MIPTRWVKVLKDLWSYKGRTLTVAVSIAVGVFAVGLASNAYLTILQDMNADFQLSNPHQAVLYVSPFNSDDLATVRKVPGVVDVNGRGSFSGRVETLPGKWSPILIGGLSDLEEVTIDLIRPGKDGEQLNDLARHEIWIERSSLSLLPVKVGDTITVEVSEGHAREFRVAATVHDARNAPTPFTGQVIAFVNMDSMEWLTGSNRFSEMLLTVSGNQRDEEHVTAIAQDVQKRLEKSGLQVYATVIYRPGEHPIFSVLQALLAMMGLLGLLAVFLSTFLVINTINALMAQQVRQIGIMKAVGGRNGQIALMYLVLVFSFGLIAVLLAVPLAGAVNYGLTRLMISALNGSPGPFRIPLASIILQVGVGFSVPLVVELLPVFKGARQTVREAISDYGINVSGFGLSWFDRLLERTWFLSRPLALSIRNTFRKKGRLALTLFTLTLGGAIFIAVFNLRASFSLTIADVLGYFLSDVTVITEQYYRVNEVEHVIYSVPGVKLVESWGVANGRVLSVDKQTSTDVLIWAPPGGSKLIKPSMIAGRWLVPEDQNAVAVSNHFLAQRPDVKLGDYLTVKIGEKEFSLQVVGFFKMAGTVIPPFVYVNKQYLDQMLGLVDRAASYRIETKTSDPQLQKKVAEDLENGFKAHGIRVSTILTGAETQGQQAVSTNILVYALLAMAILVALVGAIGLSGTMSMNVMERTREIGVIRSFGASNFAVLMIVMVEGMLIGMISWALGALLAARISKLLRYVVGMGFVQCALAYVFSSVGLVVWLIIVVVLSGLASLMPALGAVRLTVRDVLSYE